MKIRALFQKYVFVIGLSVTLVGIILLMVSPTLGSALLANIVINLGTTFVETGLIVVIYQLAITDILTTKQMEESGLIDFRMKRSELFLEEPLSRRLRGSRIIRIMGITLSSIIDELSESTIIGLANANTRFTFLIFDPDTEILKHRENQENRSRDRNASR